MDFVHNDVYMRKSVSHHIACVDLQLRGNDSTKISKNLKLPTCASISMHMVSDIEI
jgi:hypothetical protein